MLAGMAFGADVNYTYNLQGAEPRGFGFSKAETYDVAILVDEASFNGSQITAIEVALPGDNIEATSVWLSSELKLERQNGKYVNAPDLAVTDAVVENGVLRAVFAEPIAVTGPLYAGYSFTVTEQGGDADMPVSVVDGDAEGGLFIHSSRTKLKWKSSVDQAEGVSAMKVTVAGNFADNAAVMKCAGDAVASAEADDNILSMIVANHGLNELRSVEYTYSVGGNKGSGKFDFETPVPAIWGASVLVSVNVGNLAVKGEYEGVFTITKVNGADNTDASPAVAQTVIVYPFVPLNRPLVEEYTGLWCGWCTRGYACLENMREWYPGQFLALAYHSGDEMDFGASGGDNVSGYPSAFLNNTSMSISNIYSQWPKLAANLAPLGVDVNVAWTDETMSVLKASANVRFIEDMSKGSYDLTYALVADGLTDKSWKQNNSYAPKEGEEPKDSEDMPGYWGEFFTHGESVVRGLVYNDVALETTASNKYPNVIPSEIVAGETYSHTMTFEIGDKYSSIPLDKTKLRVVAYVTDKKTKKIVNANSSDAIGDISSVGAVGVEPEIVRTQWYDLNGMEVSSPAKGIFIRIDTYTDGRRTATKTVL